MQQYKIQYENLFTKRFSDQTWYRVIKLLKQSGIQESDYPTVFKLLATMNKDRDKLIVFADGFTDIWENLRQLQDKLQGINRGMTCDNFRNHLFKMMRARPKHKNTYYRWFHYAGLPYKADKVYSFEQLIGVAANAFCWMYRQQQSQNKKLEQSIIDVEII